MVVSTAIGEVVLRVMCLHNLRIGNSIADNWCAAGTCGGKVAIPSSFRVFADKALAVSSLCIDESFVANLDLRTCTFQPPSSSAEPRVTASIEVAQTIWVEFNCMQLSKPGCSFCSNIVAATDAWRAH